MNHLNIYVCPDGHKTVTIDLVQGVTPFIIECKNEHCKKEATSSFYRCDQTLEPTYEWYTPDDIEYSTLSEGEKEHVDLGGLLLRKIKKI